MLLFFFHHLWLVSISDILEAKQHPFDFYTNCIRVKKKKQLCPISSSPVQSSFAEAIAHSSGAATWKGFLFHGGGLGIANDRLMLEGVLKSPNAQMEGYQ